METREVKDRKGTFSVYDHRGDLVGTVCTDTGRAMIGKAFWQRADGGFVDLRGLLALSDKVFSDTEEDVTSSETVPAHVAAKTLRDVATSIRELCGAISHER